MISTQQRPQLDGPATAGGDQGFYSWILVHEVTRTHQKVNQWSTLLIEALNP